MLKCALQAKKKLAVEGVRLSAPAAHIHFDFKHSLDATDWPHKVGLKDRYFPSLTPTPQIGLSNKRNALHMQAHNKVNCAVQSDSI